ncbi:hypothetical protein HELRODRAFT_102708 [Helobdella robusta]|uniref:AAA+ ATPase domain-containing protein n=1 Tax=Helobdella robusta TaxID=6412 RepID=T1EDB1_HELRO|nr:hypothetical protein HELRODRAFT_102708 [Helobdella robusta]ESN95105.1 hypothetical protein HELRODRAFT_102708 [Helobdella robusta]
MVNYELLRERVDKIPLPQIPDTWIPKLIQSIPSRYKNSERFKNVLDGLVDEISSMFHKSMKEFTSKYLCVCVCTFEKMTSPPTTTTTIEITLGSCKEQFQQHRKRIKLNLHVLKASVRLAFELGEKALRRNIICDFKLLCQKSPFTIKYLRSFVSRECDSFEERTMTGWLVEIIKIFESHKDVEKLKGTKLQSYNRCLDILMSIQLRDLIERSVDTWLQLITSVKYITNNNLIPMVLVALTYEDGSVQFYPTTPDVQGAFCEVVDKIANTLQLVPTVSSSTKHNNKNHNDDVTGDDDDDDFRYINCKLNDDEVGNIHASIRSSMEENTYGYVVNGDAMNDVINRFDADSTSTEELIKMSEQFEKVSREISTLPRLVHFGLVVVDSSDLKQELCKGCKLLSSYILDRLAGNLALESSSLISEYEQIYKRASEVPDNSEQLVELIQFIDTARTKELVELKIRVSEFAQHLVSLLSCYLFSKERMASNTRVVLWPSEISPIFELSGEKAESLKVMARKMLSSSSEQLFAELKKIRDRCQEFNDYVDVDQMAFYATCVKSVQQRLNDAIEKGKWINREESIYKCPITDFREAEDIAVSLELFYRLFSVVSKWRKAEKRWMDGTFLELSAGQIEADLEEYAQEMYKVNKQFINRRKKKTQSKIMTSVKTIKEKITNNNEEPAVFQVINAVLESMKKFRNHIPTIMVLCNLGLRQRHWTQMSDLAKFDLTPDSSTTLRKMLTLNLGPYMEQFEAISASASKEFSLEKAKKKMLDDWTNVKFNLTLYRETGVSILASVDEIQMLLEDQIVKTQTMRGSPFIRPFEKEIKQWEQRMTFIQDGIVEWLKVQAQWLYLDPIFASEDITRQMPDEARMFAAVDLKWKGIMKNTVLHPLVLSATSYPNLLDILKECTTLLDSINKGLNMYLELKRLFFPRLFFFLSNDEMLEILSETKDPTRVQPHLKKCFEGACSLEFNEKLEITAMRSSESEKVVFSEVVCTQATKGAVEKWLLNVQQVMLMSIKHVIQQSNAAYLKESRVHWVMNWPGQVILCVSQIHWTAGVHRSIKERTLNEFETHLNKQLSEIVELIRGSLTRHQRITLGALVVIDVHARDVVKELTDRKIENEKDFAWMAQLRYYIKDGNDTITATTTAAAAATTSNNNGDVVVSIVNAMAKYAYEYLGNTDRLVITPLTDRCYRTLMGAFQLNLNGAPEGPAGTGKTETTKDLAKALAVQCVVFNCSDGLDYIAMGKFFKGLASSGAWSCFDEFNRIELEVLSVVAQQILCIIRAVQSHVDVFIFEGTELKLNPNCFLCVTMNPGYAGRSELPDNLKVLFRTVAMMVPDYAMIAEISLYSFGFINARQLSVKIVTTYRLCSEQLSTQFHYDYGMRAVKAVLCAAGNLKLNYKDADESILMLRSIMEVNLPKFLAHDIPLFEGIISDLFPNVKLPKERYSQLLDAVDKVASDDNLTMVDFFAEKLIQMNEMMTVRHGFMLVGEPYGGKSTVIHTMAKAMNYLANNNNNNNNNNNSNNNNNNFSKVTCKIINPKSITMGQLYGQFDAVSHEWSDGLIAITFREFASHSMRGRRWVIFDGPIDALWIENMNTVLDDNKKLCLMSGEVIQLPTSMNLIFETLDLSMASPATVSRCGMIYFEPKMLGWQCMLHSWLRTLKNNINDNSNDIKNNDSNINNHNDKSSSELVYIDIVAELKKFVVYALEGAIEFVTENCRATYLRMTVSMLVGCFFRFVTMVIRDAHEKLFGETSSSALDDQLNRLSHLFKLIIFSLVWSIGCVLDENDRIKFNARINELMNINELTKNNVLISIDGGGKFENSRKVADVYGGLLPAHGELVYDYYVENNEWLPWLLKAEEKQASTSKIVTSSSAKLQNVLIPTVDTERYNGIMDFCIRYKEPLLIVGPTGTGKSVYVREKLLRGVQRDVYKPAFINFSAQTTANQTQNLIMSKLEKRRKGYYGPPINKKSIIFIDDFNLPSHEKFGAQPPLELLRFCLEHGHWYDLKDTSKIHLQDVQFIGAMVPTMGGIRGHVDGRVLRHFLITSVNSFSDESLVRIFSCVVLTFLKSANETKQLELTKFGLKIVEATKDIYKTSTSILLPTPNKSHYLFNLRDFSRVVSGLSLVQKAHLNDTSVLIRLWCHEVLRVFSDRLVNSEDKVWLADLIEKTINKHFDVKFHDVFEHLLKDRTSYTTADVLSDLMFGSYMCIDKEVDERTYDEVNSMKDFHKVVEQYLDEYNVVNKTRMNLVIFKYALEHLSRISRILLIPGGNMLLVGVGGSGRQSVTRLAAYISNVHVNQPEITKSYGINEWHDDLKALLRNAGAHNKPCIFFLVDSQLNEDSFLEEVDNLLNAGEVSNIFSADEYVDIVEIVSNNNNDDLTPLELYAHFVERSKANLHIIITFSPIGGTFRSRLRQYPSLVNCCTIDWYQPWPSDALHCVAAKFLENVKIKENEKRETVEICQYFHSSSTLLSVKYLEQLGRHTYVTPTSYLEMINLLSTLINSKQDSTMKAKKRYVCGLEKLAFAASQVADMQNELENLKPQLIKMAEENVRMMKNIDDESQEMEYTSEIVRSEEVVAKRQAASAQELKDECEAELAEAIPALETAITALNTLKPSDITIVKSMVNPPSGVKLVMAAVCVMKGIPPEKIVDPNGTGAKILDFWGPSKKLLGDLNFLKDLKEFDKDSIQVTTMTKIRKEFINNPDFDPNKVANASSAAEGLCKWVLAMEIYDRVAKIVAPKKEKMRLAEAELKKTLDQLKMKRAELKSVEERLMNLKHQFQEMLEKKEKLEKQVALCEAKLDRAERLIKGLGGEKERWTDATVQLQLRYDSLLGDILLSAASIAYLGPYTLSFREMCIADWIKVCQKHDISVSSNFSLSLTLGDPVVIQSWNIAGLPNDPFSIDNAVIIANSTKWPLMIDPQGQANYWTKNMEKENKLQVIRLTESDYMRTLENCISFGNPILLENVQEELDPVFEPLLLKQTYKQSGVDMIRLGENVIEYSSDFRFYVTTRVRNPHYLPEVATKVALINFMITREGLEDQLLGIVVAKERPDLETERQSLILLSAENNKQLKEIEDKILVTLSQSEGNILEDETTVDFLDKSKMLSNEILKKQKVAMETEKQMDVSRQCYRPVAKHSAVLFFSVADLPNIDPMYQYSLSWFINLFRHSILDSNKSKILEKRISYLKNHFQHNLYENICRSLFDRHKLIFSFLLCANLLIANNEMTNNELLFFLTGGTGLNGPTDNPDSTWISERMWNQLCNLKQLSIFKDFISSFKSSINEWRVIYDDPSPHHQLLPPPWSEKLSDFQKLIIIRCIRPDKVIPATEKFIAEKLGQTFVEPPKFDLIRSYEDSDNCAPLIFVLSSGADPTAALMKFASDKGYHGDKFQSVSLGQGQGPVAARAIQQARLIGGWVLLQNCHLAISWMLQLEKICEGFKKDNTHAEFRLWLTSYPSDKFPVSVLQNGIKMTNEPPSGLKENLLQSYTSEPINDSEFFLGCPNKQHVFEKLVYGLCFFHALVQERKSFGATGFNIPYAFNQSDLRISLRQLQMFVNEYEKIPFDALTYLTGECNYGGRVTDDWDRRCLLTMLADFYNDDVIQAHRYKFSDGYLMPGKGTIEQYIEYIKHLPSSQPPQVFGMHENMNIMKHVNDTKQLFQGLLAVVAATLAASGCSEEKLYEIASEVLKKMDRKFDTVQASHRYPVVYEDSMNTVLVQEMTRYNRLIETIQKSLTDLQRAIRGLDIMSSEMESLGGSLLIGRIPDLWVGISYPSLKPLSSYIHDLTLRLKFMQNWYDNGKPDVFWISGFYFVQAFLTGVMQNHARSRVLPIDQLAFDFEILNTFKVADRPKYGAYIDGLFLDGGKWDVDSGLLVEQEMNVLYSPVPVIWLKPIKKVELLDGDPRYKCPMYKTSKRCGTLSTTGHSTNFIIIILLTSGRHHNHWIKRGTALLCQLDD